MVAIELFRRACSYICTKTDERERKMCINSRAQPNLPALGGPGVFFVPINEPPDRATFIFHPPPSVPGTKYNVGAKCGTNQQIPAGNHPAPGGQRRSATKKKVSDLIKKNLKNVQGMLFSCVLMNGLDLIFYFHEKNSCCEIC